MIEEGASGTELTDQLLSDIKRTSGLASRYSQGMDIEEPVVDLETQIRGRYEQEFKESADYLAAKERMLASLNMPESGDETPVVPQPKLNKGLGSRPEKTEDQSIAEFIASFELSEQKETYEAYWDEKQYSIGFGTKAKSKDEVITHEEAISRLNEATAKAKKDVIEFNKKFNYDWNQDQINALTSFTYNLGRENLLTLIESGRRGTEEIADMILEYNMSGGKVNPGLTKRRKAEYELFSSGSIAD